jgi:hypothetical protein
MVTATTKAKAMKSTDKVTLYDKLIATRPEIERKGDANPYTAVNGNMFTILVGSERLGIFEEVWDDAAGGLWRGDEGVCRGSRCFAGKDEGAGAVSGFEL